MKRQRTVSEEILEAVYGGEENVQCSVERARDVVKRVSSDEDKISQIKVPQDISYEQLQQWLASLEEYVVIPESVGTQETPQLREWTVHWENFGENK